MIELIISHNGKNWIGKNDFLLVEASTLEELDNELRNLLKQKGSLEKGKRIDIFMAFDNSTIPTWIRQYGQHYFNRIVRLEN